MFMSALGVFLVLASRGYSLAAVLSLSLQWLLLLQSSGPRHTGFSSRGAWAQLLHDLWDLPGPGKEPVSLALAGRFLSTATREVQSIETD